MQCPAWAADQHWGGQVVLRVWGSGGNFSEIQASIFFLQERDQAVLYGYMIAKFTETFDLDTFLHAE